MFVCVCVCLDIFCQFIYIHLMKMKCVIRRFKSTEVEIKTV